MLYENICVYDWSFMTDSSRVHTKPSTKHLEIDLASSVSPFKPPQLQSKQTKDFDVDKANVLQFNATCFEVYNKGNKTF